MDMLKKYWARAFKANDGKSLAMAIIFYIVADFVCGLIIGLLGALPLVGFLFNIVGWLAGIYFFVGIILAILNFLKVLK